MQALYPFQRIFKPVFKSHSLVSVTAVRVTVRNYGFPILKCRFYKLCQMLGMVSCKKEEFGKLVGFRLDSIFDSISGKGASGRLSCKDRFKETNFRVFLELFFATVLLPEPSIPSSVISLPFIRTASSIFLLTGFIEMHYQYL